MPEATRPVAVGSRARLALRGRLLLTAFDLMTRVSLRGIWVRGDVPTGPVVWATNHHHWWDAFVAGSVLRTTGQRPTVLIAPQSLGSFSFLHWIDAVPADDTPRAVESLRAGRTLVIMPEGRMTGPGPLGPIRGGAGRIAQAAGVPLLPIALRVVVRGHQHADVFVDIGAPVPPAALADAMSGALVRMDLAISATDPDEALPGFRPVVRGRQSVNELLSGRRRGRLP